VTLDEYITRYEPRIRGLIGAFQITGDDADDVVAIVRVKVWRCLETGWVRPGIAPMTWLAPIARHAAIDWIRRQRVRARHEMAWPMMTASYQDDPTDTYAVPHAVADPAPWPDLQAELDEMTIDVRRAVAALPDYQRPVVVLAYWEGLPHTAIAERLGVPLGTVKTRMTGGRKKLRAALAGVA
jgi:RNA polymerase sigma-70 factor (ECF subfamily)